MKAPLTHRGVDEDDQPGMGKPAVVREVALAVILHEIKRPLNLMRLTAENGLSHPSPQVDSLAERLSLSVLTVRAWLRSGRLPGVKPGGRVWRVRELGARSRGWHDGQSGASSLQQLYSSSTSALQQL